MRNSQIRSGRATTLALLAVAAVGPVAYPALLAWRTRRRSDPVAPAPEEWPSVTVVIPAYREQSVIAMKVENTLANGYPGPLDVIVVADDPKTAAAARATPTRVVEGGKRRGKAGALNLGVREATGDVVVLTDSNAMIEPGGLAKLVRWLDDPTVGAVTGEKQVVGDGGEGAYWNFEAWLKRRENRIGSTIGLSGELVALRRADYAELPIDTAVDDLWLVLDVAERGQGIVYEPKARVYEAASKSARVEWERRTRIVSGTIDTVVRRPRHLLPGAPLAYQLWGHRFLRSSPGPLAHALLVLRAVAAVRRSVLARVFLGIHAFGLASFLRVQCGGDPGRFGRVVGQVLFLQAAAIGGTARWARGDRPALWPKPERASAAGDRPPAEAAVQTDAGE